MAKKTAPSPPTPPETTAPALLSLATRYLDFWQRNLLAWSNDIALPKVENSKDG